MYELSKKLFKSFVINQRYFAVQKSGYYIAKNQFINQKTIERILQNKESFLCYQEDFNYIKWICFDFDINKDLIDSGEFEKNKQKLYSELVDNLKQLTSFLDKKQIGYLLEFSGNRGIHIWILFDEEITRQDGFFIFQSILKQVSLNLDSSKFSLDKYPKSLYSTTSTDKGTGVKIPLSFHQKSKQYSCFFESIDKFNLENLNIVEFNNDFLDNQFVILNSCIQQDKEEVFKKLSIKIEDLQEEKQIYLKTKYVSSNDKDLENIIPALSNCKHIESIFAKSKPNEKERRIIVGLLSQLKENNTSIGKRLLYSYFMDKEGAVESIIKQRLAHIDKFYPPTCDFLRAEYNIDCKCEKITKTPLEFLDGFKYLPEEIFDITEEIFYSIKASQIKYTKQNDEIALFHTLNNLHKYEYLLMKNYCEEFLHEDFNFNHHNMYIRKENDKRRTLYSISARDKLITTYGIKLLDSIFYKNFSSRSFGYRFNPSFRQYDIFENWFKQWNMYIKELKTLIYSEDYKEYYVLKLDLKSFYYSIDLEKLQIELNIEIHNNLDNGLINASEKDIFINIVNNLLKFTKNITANQTKGLPQGPAYARYLAELYLTSLDRLIESKIARVGNYYRYVDDIFIIMPDKKSINDIETAIIEHLDTKYLVLNDTKKYSGVLNDFKHTFEDYIDNSKYFIDFVSKHQAISAKSIIHSASSKLLELIKNKDQTINDKNLTFFFTHLNNSDLINSKKEEIENYVIEEVNGRGSFFNIFWRYYFNKYIFNDIDFVIFKKLKGLKRESFLNSLIIVTKNMESIENKTLKSLLDHYLKTELSSLEKLLILEIYIINSELFNQLIISIIGNEITIYNDLMLSEFSKDIPEQVLEAIIVNLIGLDISIQFDYIYNIMLFSENLSLKFLSRFSDIFIKAVNSIIGDNLESDIKYLWQKSQVQKYIQLLYLSTLFYIQDDKDDFENIISPAWRNLLYNLDKNKNIQVNDIQKLSYWKDKLEKISLKESNINFIMPLVYDGNNKLSDAFPDEYQVVTNYFDSLIELIYLDNRDDVAALKELQEIKTYLIDEKKVKYLQWLNGDHNIYFPTKDICIKNSIHNDITILKKENRILVRLRNDLDFNIDIDYLTIEEQTQEVIFDGKYKTIIYSYIASEFVIPFQEEYTNIFDLMKVIIDIHLKLNKFSNTYYNDKSYINYFYKQFTVHKEKQSPLIPYDLFSNYFIKDNNHYNIKNDKNYFDNMIEVIEEKKLKFFNNEPSKIFDNFKKSLFPRQGLANYTSKLEYLKIFNEKIKDRNPRTIFEMESYLIETIFDYNKQLDKIWFYNFFNMYMSLNREDIYKNYLLFYIYSSFTLENKTLNDFFTTIKNSLEKNPIISKLLKDEILKLTEKIGPLDEYIKAKLDYEPTDGTFEITLNDNPVNLDELEYIELNRDELNFSNVPEEKFDYLKTGTLYYSVQEGIHKIVVVPLILQTIYAAIKDRKKAFDKGSESYLFHPYKSIHDLMQDPNWGKAVEILQDHYRYGPKEFETQNNIEQHLNLWLNCFHNSNSISSMLYIIANHQSFTEDITNIFLEEMQIYSNLDKYFITTLKSAEDNNGAHRLITKQSDGNLWRKLDLKKFPQKFFKSKKKKIVFLSDNIISGSQTVKAFENYYLNENKLELLSRIFNLVIYPKEADKFDYFKINAWEFKKFKEKLLTIEEIVFLSVIYTDKAEKSIKEYFKKIGFIGKVYLKGTKKDYKDCVFQGLIEEDNKKTFKSIVQDREFMNSKFETSNYYKRYSELKETDTFNDRNRIVRFNSMPKKRFFIFTLKPKDYHKPLFEYIDDK